MAAIHVTSGLCCGAPERAAARAIGPVSLPDAYCVATAKHTRSSLASFDLKVRKAAQGEGLETA